MSTRLDTAMKFFEVDWKSILTLCRLWENLPEDSQLSYFFGISPMETPISPYNVLDPDLLVEQGFLTFSSTKNTLEFSKTSRQFHEFLSGLINSEIQLEDGDSLNHLIEYMNLFYSDHELKALTDNYEPTRKSYEEIAEKIGNAYWIKQFLDADSLQIWEPGHDFRERLPLIDMPVDNEYFNIAQKIIKALVNGPIVFKLAAITKIAETNDLDLISRAISLLVKNILVFFSLSENDYAPFIGLHPTIHNFIQPRVIKPARSDSPTTNCPPFLIDDMTILLIEASANPIPIRQSDNKPYAKSIKEITSRFYRLPKECNCLHTYTDEERLRMAMFSLKNHGLTNNQRKETDKKNYLCADRKGKMWLQLSERERLETMLLIQRDYYEELDNLNRSRFPLNSKCLSRIEIVRKEYDVTYREPNLAGSLYYAIKSLAKKNHTVTLLSFLQSQIFMENPLFTLLHCGVPFQKPSDWFLQPVIDKHEMIDFWSHSLKRFLINIIIPYGILNIGKNDDTNKHSVSLSKAGLFFTGNLKKLPTEKKSANTILIQPNFEIVFMAQNPRAEVKLGRFCERLDSGVGTLFRISRKSILKAASNGLDSKSVLNDMAEVSHKPVPPNVAEQVKNWMSQCRQVSISTKVLFTCPDRETALHVKSSGGDKVEQISDTVIAVSDRQLAKTLEKKLEKKGIFRKRG